MSSRGCKSEEAPSSHSWRKLSSLRGLQDALGQRKAVMARGVSARTHVRTCDGLAQWAITPSCCRTAIGAFPGCWAHFMGAMLPRGCWGRIDWPVQSHHTPINPVRSVQASRTAPTASANPMSSLA